MLLIADIVLSPILRASAVNELPARSPMRIGLTVIAPVADNVSPS